MLCAMMKSIDTDMVASVLARNLNRILMSLKELLGLIAVAIAQPAGKIKALSISKWRRSCMGMKKRKTKSEKKM